MWMEIAVVVFHFSNGSLFDEHGGIIVVTQTIATCFFPADQTHSLAKSWLLDPCLSTVKISNEMESASCTNNDQRNGRNYSVAFLGLF